MTSPATTTVVIQGVAEEPSAPLELTRVDVRDVSLWLDRFSKILRPYFAERGIVSFTVTTIAANGDREEFPL